MEKVISETLENLRCEDFLPSDDILENRLLFGAIHRLYSKKELRIAKDELSAAYRQYYTLYPDMIKEQLRIIENSNGNGMADIRFIDVVFEPANVSMNEIGKRYGVYNRKSFNLN
ncbi:MAG TPA: hypothetical protein DEP48_00905 [Persephonella sp.]|uniref:Uncharacterized protein n=1 Tax=Persephonella marina (strain DSM 14350 / EX-H1) TaxID=123214 RepID=C0QR50_PERMH|nr:MULTISPECIES: hypothetical protein [Persephonella]ACO03320.1 hypothetical protein PERMA_1377 [Persephonella marina EX-H1]HCB68894.1 hypothetical protein [Persephonella sp.]